MKILIFLATIMLLFLSNVSFAGTDKYSGFKPEKLLKNKIYVCDAEDLELKNENYSQCRYLFFNSGTDGSKTYIDLENLDFVSKIAYILTNLPQKSSFVAKIKINCETQQFASIADWHFEGYFQTGKLLSAENSSVVIKYISPDPGSLGHQSVMLFCAFSQAANK